MLILTTSLMGNTARVAGVPLTEQEQNALQWALETLAFVMPHRGNFTGQQWTMQPLPGGFVSLTTAFRGPQMCLDVVNGGARNNQVELRPCGNFTGQQWRLQRLPQGTYRLTTAFRGPRMCLDVVNGGPRDNHAELRRCGNFTGQFWSIVPYTP